MAMVKLSSEIVEINGKSGGVVWRRDTCGQHIQKIPLQLNREPSPTQKIRRRCFRKLYDYWAGVLSDASREIWRRYADRHPRHNKKGEVIFWCGYHWWIHFNMEPCRKGEPIFLTPPE